MPLWDTPSQAFSVESPPTSPSRSDSITSAWTTTLSSKPRCRSLRTWEPASTFKVDVNCSSHFRVNRLPTTSELLTAHGGVQTLCEPFRSPSEQTSFDPINCRSITPPAWGKENHRIKPQNCTSQINNAGTFNVFAQGGLKFSAGSSRKCRVSYVYGGCRPRARFRED